jgi:hypothetical protein
VDAPDDELDAAHVILANPFDVDGPIMQRAHARVHQLHRVSSLGRRRGLGSSIGARAGVGRPSSEEAYTHTHPHAHAHTRAHTPARSPQRRGARKWSLRRLRWARRWTARAHAAPKSRRRCGRGEPRRGRGEPSPGADVAGVSPASVTAIASERSAIGASASGCARRTYTVATRWRRGCDAWRAVVLWKPMRGLSVEDVAGVSPVPA